MLGETVTLRWQQNSQNFVIAGGSPPAGVTPGRPSGLTGYLENPGPHAFQSGIGVLSGWVCEAETVALAIGALPVQVAAYGTERLDTLEVCGDTDNGFGLLFNWNLLDDGEHEVVAYVDGTELGRATVWVTTLGAEFLRGAEGECTVADFPSPGEDGDPGVATEPTELCDYGHRVRERPPAPALKCRHLRPAFKA